MKYSGNKLFKIEILLDQKLKIEFYKILILGPLEFIIFYLKIRNKSGFKEY
jgi:hypothetical protein